MSSKGSVDKRRQRVAESLQVGNPGNNARDLAIRFDPQRDSQNELSVDEVRSYENNPRRAVNGKFDDIKESIRTSGLRNPITVTRRPGEAHFIVEAGGNTRLLALQQLWAETRDPRYRTLIALFRPWQSESHVLTAHLIENEQRGDMTFWDKAAGVVALKGRLEVEQGRVLSLRLFEDALHDLGLSVNTATLAHYLFALERLRTLGEAVAHLSGLDVKTLQPRLNALKRYAQARVGMSEDDFYSQIVEPVFYQITAQYPRTHSFSVAATCDACEQALAQHVGAAVDVLRVEMAQGKSPGPERKPARGPSETVNAMGVNSKAVTAADRWTPVVPEPCGTLRAAVQAFAESAGIGECVRSESDGLIGGHLSALPLDSVHTHERRRAWWLLAGIYARIEFDEVEPVPLNQSFLQWLADLGDPSARAFWDLLTILRQTQDESGRSRMGTDPTISEGDA